MLRSWLAPLAIVALFTASAFAFLITGGEGNEPIRDPGWPDGAGVVFNLPSRIAYWVGPPFGGGQYHGEYRGDAGDLNNVLPNFAKIDTKTKRLVLHNGVGHSFWLNPNNELAKTGIAQIDWMFIVWQPASWKKLLKLPAGLRPRDLGDDKTGPPVQIDVYTGGNIHWADVVVPQGIEVIDERMEAHGFTPADGTVLEGTVTDLETKKPLPARVELRLIESKKKGGYRYTVIGKMTTDAKGHWVLKHAPIGWQQIVLLADEYVPRVIGYGQFTGEPGWHPYNGALAKPASVVGRVVDEAGKPLADVAVRLDDVACHDEEYKTQDDFKTNSNADGRFQFDMVPVGKARIWITKDGYCIHGLGPSISVPTKDLAIAMSRSGQVNVTVDFGAAKRPAEYIVDFEPEGGNKVGSWGGSSQIDAENKHSFKNVPPGRYFLRGHPNPTTDAEVTQPIKVDVKGGATEEITLPAKTKKLNRK